MSDYSLSSSSLKLPFNNVHTFEAAMYLSELVKLPLVFTNVYISTSFPFHVFSEPWKFRLLHTQNVVFFFFFLNQLRLFSYLGQHFHFYFVFGLISEHLCWLYYKNVLVMKPLLYWTIWEYDDRLTTTNQRKTFSDPSSLYPSSLPPL